MSIRTKVIGGFIAILFLFAGVSVYNYSRLGPSNDQLVLVNEIFLPLSRLTAELQGKIYTLAEDMRRFYFFSDRTSEQSTFSRMARDLYPYIIHRKFAAGEALLEKGTGELVNPLLGELKKELQIARDTFDKLSTETKPKQFRELYVKLRNELRTLSKRLDDEAQKITRSAQAEGRDTLIASLSLSTLIILFSLFAIAYAHKVLKSLPTLIDRLRKIADGDFLQSLKVPSDSKDEVSMLAREYNRMLDALCERDKMIQAQQKELLQTERLAAVGQLSAEVVHEIRNPLNSISLNIDWLQSEMAEGEEETTKTLKSIAKEVERLNQITESYLVRARVPAQTKDRSEAHDVLKEILQFSKEEDRAQNIKVQMQLAQDRVYVQTSRSRLKQIFINVLKNAKEAMPRGGEITIRTRVKQNTSIIEFEDTGYGMNEDTKRKSFSPFYTTKQNGTGLGLVLTKSLVDEAHGSVRCRSELGKGTTFTFQFPV